MAVKPVKSKDSTAVATKPEPKVPAVDPREAEWLEAGNPRLGPEPEAEPKPEPEARPAPEPEPTIHKHSRRLLNETREWLPHMSREEIDATPSDTLDDMVYAAQRQYRIASERQNEAIRQRERAQPTHEPEVDSFDDEFKDWDPASKQALKKIDTRKEVAALKKQIEELQGSLRQRDQQTLQQRLQAKSREHKLNAKQTAAVIGVLQSLERLDLTNIDIEFDDSVRELGFVKSEPAPKPKAKEPVVETEDEPDDMDRELAERKKQWAEGGLAKNTQRGEELPPGKERFIQNWNRRRREVEQSDEEFEREFGLNGK